MRTAKDELRSKMSPGDNEIVFLILQFLKEKDFNETVNKLEEEFGLCFDMDYFAKAVKNGKWEELEKYWSVFNKFDDALSLRVIFEIRRQRYLEALDKNDGIEAVDILANDLKTISLLIGVTSYKETKSLIRLQKFRDSRVYRQYRDTESSRALLLAKINELINANPQNGKKLQFPTMEISRLKILLNQSLNWQHHLCKYPKPNPKFTTLFNDHICEEPNGAAAQSPAANPSPIRDPGHSHHVPAPPGSTRPDNAEQSHLLTADDLPNTVVANLTEGSAVKTMDFHPVHQTLLAVGTSAGDVSLWKVERQERLAHKTFKLWDRQGCTLLLQVHLAGKYPASTNRVRWSADGRYLGVAYSKNLVHLYHYYNHEHGLMNHLEIDAHVGSVNDVAFSHPRNALSVITCGHDKLIKVWNAFTGRNQYTLAGHEAPVYSVCPHQEYQVIFSTATDGKMIRWTYDNIRESRAEFDAPGLSCMTMTSSTDAARLFSCGTNNDGQSQMVEWDAPNTVVKRTYVGLGKNSVTVVHFDTSRNRFLAAGDEFLVKYWNMDNVNLLLTVDAGGGLEASPCVGFNKEGSLLAVSTIENGLKVLANAEGVKLITRSREEHARPVPVLPEVTYCTWIGPPDPDQFAPGSSYR